MFRHIISIAGCLTVTAFFVAACEQDAADQVSSTSESTSTAGGDRDLGARACHALISLTDTDIGITTTELVPAEGVLPEYCHVTGIIQPNVGFEVKLPTEWNGKFYQAGNGGFAGSFQDDQSYGLRRGYATAATDTGHEGSDPSFALSRPAEIDFGYRSIHVTQAVAKRLIEEYYGRGPAYSYYKGCSTGGRQGLLEAQRFPDDFDGIITGAPVYDFSVKQTFNAAWGAKALLGNNGEGRVPQEKLKTISDAVYGKCDAIDGLEDGIIDDPRQCDFDPMRDLQQCAAGADSAQCFTAAQLEAIKKVYDGPGDYYNREGYYPGHVVGGEWMADGSAGPGPFGAERLYARSNNFFKYFAFSPDRPDFDVLTDLDFSNPPEQFASEKTVDASDPDLSRFHAGGGKLIMWHGWADTGLIPIRTIQYYEQVQETMGADVTEEFARLYMLPGVYHCWGGRGPDVFDDLAALEQWVEEGVAPDRITAYKMPPPRNLWFGRKGLLELDKAVMSRPLCPYPQVARYDGSGSTDDAENFNCVMPEE